jgi:hypothetical protein
MIERYNFGLYQANSVISCREGGAPTRESGTIIPLQTKVNLSFNQSILPASLPRCLTGPFEATHMSAGTAPLQLTYVGAGVNNILLSLPQNPLTLPWRGKSKSGAVPKNIL